MYSCPLVHLLCKRPGRRRFDEWRLCTTKLTTANFDTWLYIKQQMCPRNIFLYAYIQTCIWANALINAQPADVCCLRAKIWKIHASCQHWKWNFGHICSKYSEQQQQQILFEWRQTEVYICMYMDGLWAVGGYGRVLHKGWQVSKRLKLWKQHVEKNSKG